MSRPRRRRCRPRRANTDAAKLYEAKPGYANYLLQQAGARPASGRFPQEAATSAQADQGDWTIKGDPAPCGKNDYARSQIGLKAATKEEQDRKGRSATIDQLDYSLEPLSTETKLEDLQVPTGQRRPAGGPVPVPPDCWPSARRVSPRDFSHGGVEPFYPPLPAGQEPDYAKRRVMCEVLRTSPAGVPAKWYFSQNDGDRCSASRSRWTATTTRARCTCRSTAKKVDGRSCRAASKCTTRTRPMRC